MRRITDLAIRIIAFAAALPCLAVDARAQSDVWDDFTDGDFSGPFTVSVRGVAAHQRVESGGYPNGPFWRGTLSLPYVDLDCDTGCVDSPVYLLVVRDGPTYDPLETGPITRFDGCGIPRVTCHPPLPCPQPCLLGETDVWYGLLVEQGGYLFGSRMFGFFGGNVGRCCWTECSSRGCNGVPGVSCGAGPIRPNQLQRVDGLPGGPAQFDATQAGMPFRAGFYFRVAHGPVHCCNNLCPCSENAVDVTMDLDQWRWAVSSCRPPVFTTQPSDAAVCAGETAVMTAATQADAAFQWQHNGVPLTDSPGHISGAQTGVLTISNATASDSGAYECVASGPCPPPHTVTRRTSAVASLVVYQADYNNDGLTNSHDYFAFLEDFFAGDADFNNDGLTNSNDYFDFLAAFFAGC